MPRKSARATRGQLPERYRDDDLRSTPGFEEDGSFDRSTPTSSASETPSTRSTPLSMAPPQVTVSIVRPRGRPPKRKTVKSAQNQISYPEAAFPTKEWPQIDLHAPQLMIQREEDEQHQLAGSESVAFDFRNGYGRSKLWDPAFQGYRLDGHHVDRNGHTLHGIAQYYDNHVEHFGGGDQDSQGDDPVMDKAFGQWMKDWEAKGEIMDKSKMIPTFYRWWDTTGKYIAWADDGRGDFGDKNFEKLHFRIQHAIICEIEEDLQHYPPANDPRDNTMRSCLYSHDILGIRNKVAVTNIKRMVESTRDSPTKMPGRSHYAAGKAYLSTKGLPVTLLEMYDYLDEEI